MTASFDRAEKLFDGLLKKKVEINRRKEVRASHYIKNLSNGQEEELQEAETCDELALSETAQITAAALWDIVKNKVDKSTQVSIMQDMDIKYPVDNSYPPDESASIDDLREQGFRKDETAVVMRNKHDNGALYILLTDPINGRRWLPIRTDD